MHRTTRARGLIQDGEETTDAGHEGLGMERIQPRNGEGMLSPAYHLPTQSLYISARHLHMEGMRDMLPGFRKFHMRK